MVRIKYIQENGEKCEIEARPGLTVMQTAVDNGVPGIAADCGGNCACGTCRILVDASWQSKVGEASDIEREMLNFGGDLEPGIRLACQIRVTDALDGLTVRMPAS